MKKKVLVMLLVGAMFIIGGCGSTKAENTDAVQNTVEEAAEVDEPAVEDAQTEEGVESDAVTLPLDNEEYPVETAIPEDIVSTAIQNFHNNNRITITGNVVHSILAEEILPGFIACNRDTGIEYMWTGTGDTEINSFFDKNTSIEYFETGEDTKIRVLPDTETEADAAIVDTLLAPYITSVDSFEVTEITDGEMPYYHATCNYVDESGNKYLVVMNIEETEVLPLALYVYEVQDETAITDENLGDPVTTMEFNYCPADDTSFDEMTTLPVDEEWVDIMKSDFEAMKSDYEAEQNAE